MPADLRGSWGGEHVGLTITETGSSLIFDCASGTIPGAFTVDGAGHFDISGSYTPGEGGPVTENPPPPQAASYSGRVSGRTMTLRVNPQGSPGSEYLLKQGQAPNILACL